MSKEKLLINDDKSNNSEVMRNKQIEEMAQLIGECMYKSCADTPLLSDIIPTEADEICSANVPSCMACKVARILINAGYRKQSEGEWVTSDIPQEKYVCSVCGGACWYYDYQGDVAKSRYCPNCGAKMKGVTMTNKQLAEILRSTGSSLFDRTYDPDYKLLLDEAADRLENQGQWISVEERLPQQRERVLCYSPERKSKSIFVGYIGSYSGFWLEEPCYCCISEVTHWMPLPEAPHMRKEDEGK